MTLFFVAAAAQTRTGYFVQNSTSRHFLNPAFSPEQGYVGIPFFSDVVTSAYSNMGAGTFLFPKNGSTYSCLSKMVTADEFLSCLDPVNYVEGQCHIGIVDVGFRWKENFFWNVNVKLRGDIDSYIPYEFFSFVKRGMADAESTVYVIENMNVSSDVFGQASVGFAANIPSIEGLSIGGALKALLDLGDSYISLNRMTIELSRSEYTASTSLSGFVAGKYLSLVEDRVGKVIGLEIDPSDLSLCGYGLGLDLGIAYRISTGCALDGLQFSASLTDLGFITLLSDGMTGLVTNELPVTYSGAGLTRLKSTDFTGKLNEIKDSFNELITINKEKRNENHTQKLSSEIYAGIEYPFLRNKMHVGILYYCRFGVFRTGHELSVSWNYSPVRQFNMALSYSFLNSRKSLGWMFSFTPRKGMNIFLASDYTSLQYSSHGIPVQSGYLNLSLGLSVPIQGDKYKH